MKAIIINLLKGFWLAKTKFALCVLASALSAWGIGTVAYSYMMSERDFKENFEQSNPANIILALNDSTSTFTDLLKKESSIQSLERRETVTGRIKNKRGNWMSFILYASENFENPGINKYKITAQTGQDTLQAIYIEKNGAGFLDLTTPLTIQFPNHAAADFASSGLVHDPGLPPSQMEQTVYGFAPIQTVGNFLNKSRRTLLIRLKDSEANATELKAIGKTLSEKIESNGGKVVGLIVPPPGEHPHQNIVDSLSFLQKSFGLILGGLGVILLSLILITWLYPQITNIGIMKAIGASTQMISVGYLTVLMMIILIGMVVGMPLAYKTAKFYSGFIAGVQNFEVVNTAFSLYIHALILLPAILIPILVASSPLLKP